MRGDNFVVNYLSLWFKSRSQKGHFYLRWLLFVNMVAWIHCKCKLTPHVISVSLVPTLQDWVEFCSNIIILNKSKFHSICSSRGPKGIDFCYGLSQLNLNLLMPSRNWFFQALIAPLNIEFPSSSWAFKPALFWNAWRHVMGCPLPPWTTLWGHLGAIMEARGHGRAPLFL